MESVINEMAEKFKANLREFFMGEKRSLAEAERYFGECRGHIVTGLLSAYYEKLDGEILEDKAGRRKKGLSAERHGDKVEEALNYLSNHFDAIHIRYANPEARNGGATEPHISRILSSRLSSRPMAWSETAVKHLVPILAAGQFILKKEASDFSAPSLKKASKPKKRKVAPFSLGLPDPAQAASLPARSGKVTPLFNALRPF